MRAIVAADPVTLRALQPAVHALADAFDGITTGLSTALEAEGRCWGSDEWGRAFDATYSPASAAVRALLAATATGIDDLAGVLAVVADLFAAAEDEARRRVA
jgi:hypothetical protein